MGREQLRSCGIDCTHLRSTRAGSHSMRLLETGHRVRVLRAGLCSAAVRSANIHHEMYLTL